MSELPRRLAPGTSLTAHWLNRLLDWCRGNTLRAGPGVHLDRTPSGTTISVGSLRPPRSKFMPLDCRLAAPDGGVVHCYCYVPNRNGGLVRVRAGDGVRDVTAFGMGDVRDDWLDCGQVSKGSKITLYLLCASSAGTVDEQVQSLFYSVAKSKPSGRSAELVGSHILLAELTDKGLEQRYHGSVFYSAAGREVLLDTDKTPGNPPGESLNRYQSHQTSTDPSAPIQLRQFHDVDDKIIVQGLDSTGDNPTAEHLQLLLRTKGTDVRPKLVYLDADSGLFWLIGGTDSINRAISFKLGDATTGYITFSVERAQ